MSNGDVIEIRADRSVVGASLVERTGIFLFALAAHLTDDHARPGFSKLAAFIRALLPSSRSVSVALVDGSTFRFPYGDAYWSVFCRPQAKYEPEIAALLKTVAGEYPLFIDCGANCGFWSVRATGGEFGGGRAVAIEASAATFATLEQNTKANGNRFVAMHRAISEMSGETVVVDGAAKHEQRSIVGDGGPIAIPEPVLTLAIDSIDGALQEQCPIVVKLDIEGVEVPALRGAKGVLARDTIVAYEDHGSDRGHAVSQALRDEHHMRLFHWSASAKRFEEVHDLQTLDALKVSRRVGYDFFATRSENWVRRMLGPETKTH